MCVSEEGRRGATTWLKRLWCLMLVVCGQIVLRVAGWIWSTSCSRSLPLSAPPSLNHRATCSPAAEKLLQGKRHRELLEPYSLREEAAVSYMQAVNPGAEVVAGPLTDPNEPPRAATEARFDAIVVSEETIEGAHWINRVREGLGFKPLVVVVVGLLPSKDAPKLSSTELRDKEAATERERG